MRISEVSPSLVIVGTGVKTVSHLTVEVQAYIKQADLVLYLVNEEYMKGWIQKYAKKSEPLDGLYFKYQTRIDCYNAITEYIVSLLNGNMKLCVALYGHPTVFSMPALKAAKIAINSGCEVLILPAVSAEDCLFADLMIDPGQVGCQSFEASDFLQSRRVFDPRSNLVIWQVGAIGLAYHPKFAKDFDPKNGLQKLVEYLSGFYPKDHQVVIYQAAQLPHNKPDIRFVLLERLYTVDVYSKDTLYVPPISVLSQSL